MKTAKFLLYLFLAFFLIMFAVTITTIFPEKKAGEANKLYGDLLKELRRQLKIQL